MQHHNHQRSRTPRPPLFFALPTAAEDDTSPLRSALESITWMSTPVRNLADLVGGIEALEQLDDEPVPDEPFDWTDIEDRHREAVGDVLSALDSALGTSCPAVPSDPREVLLAIGVSGIKSLWSAAVDAEYRTIVRRLLARVAQRDPVMLSRTSPDRTAAALAWLAIHGNDDLRRSTTLTAGDLWMLFRVSNCTDRGRALHRAAGFVVPEQDWWRSRQSDVWMPNVGLLHSTIRRRFVHRRADLVKAIGNERELRAAKHPIRLRENERYLSGRPITPMWAARAVVDNDRAVIALTLGERVVAPEVLALTVPDARRLVAMLGNALDAPSRPTIVQ